MKKFLIYLGAIIATVALGTTVFYLVRNNETMSISMNEVYVNTGDEFSIDFNRENGKAYTDIEIVYAGGDDDMTVVKINEVDTENGKTYTFRAGTAGLTQITFRTSNENFRNMSCKVYVGDGSADYPFYITTAEQLQRIGTPAEQAKPYGGYTLSSCYKLMNNLILKDGSNKTGCWLPIGTGTVNDEGSAIYFTGSFNGNGKTISNIMISQEQYNSVVDDSKKVAIANAGLFAGIGTNGLVYGLKIDGMRIVGKYENVGSIAAVNYGTIESCQVTGTEIDARDSAYVGGIVGKNLSSFIKSGDQYSRFIARVDRCSFSGSLGINYIEQAGVDENGNPINEKNYDISRLSGVVGGIVGYNQAGVVIYSYAEGSSFLSKQCVFGGIVGVNQDADLKNAAASSGYKYPTDIVGGNVKNCYSSLSLILDKVDPDKITSNIGGIIGYNLTASTTVIIIDGIQFSVDAIPAGGSETRMDVDNNKIIGNYFLAVDSEHAIYGIASQGKSMETVKDIMSHIKSSGKDYGEQTDAQIYESEMKYTAMSKTAEQMRKQETYISHAKDAEGRELVPWKFDVCWTIAEDSDFPRLIYSVISISDDIDDVYDNIIRTPQDLASIKVNGNYYIAADIDMNFWTDPSGIKKLWVPIGTEKNPFNGMIRAGVKEYNEDGTPKSYYTITNLQIAEEFSLTEVSADKLIAYRFAGLFGAIGETGKVYDLHIQNSSIAHKGTAEDPDTHDSITYGGYIGAIAGINKGTIVRPVVEGCLIQGESYVGGIVGCNQKGGKIIGARVADIKDDSGNSTVATRIYLNAQTNDVYAGGIAGAMLAGSSVGSYVAPISSSIATVATTVEGSVSIEVEGTDTLVYTAYVGGITGHAAGTISNAVVHSTGIISVGQELNAYAGGIAGYMNATQITGCLVQATIETGYKTYTTEAGTERTPLTYVGGIVGVMRGDGSRILKTSTYQNLLVGRMVGGLVADVSINTSYNMISKNKAKTAFSGERSTIPEIELILSDPTSTDSEYITKNACIDQCFAEALSIEAFKAGGLVCTLDNGLVSNCYVRSENGQIKSTIEGAILAGFAAEINFSSSKSEVSSGGVIAYSYVVIKIDAENGKAYAETSTSFKSPTAYTAGYILSYIYDQDVMNKDVSTKAEIQLGGWGGAEKVGKDVAGFFVKAADWIANLFNGDIPDEKHEFYQGISTGSMKNGSSSAKINECKFNTDIWNIQSGDYLTLKRGTNIPASWRPNK